MYTKEDEVDSDASMEMLQNIPPLVSNEENLDLIKYIKEHEIIKVIWGLNLDKAPSLYGCSIHIFHDYWPIIKVDLKHIDLNQMWKNKKVRGRTNSSLLALYP